MVLPALIPVVSDGVRAVIGRFSGGAGARPQNVEQTIKLQNADTDRLKALAELDKPSGEISRWVADLRASFRYIAAGFIITQAYVLILASGFGAAIPESYIDMAFQA